jgi:teichuronic acid biosynthesis glycosyltransferase TuaG
MLEISIVIPAYNAEKYIKQTLDSIAKQTVKPYEIIVVNDCSTDKTLQVVQMWNHENENSGDKYIPLTIDSVQKNQGIGATRQRGAELAKGEYVAFLSSDDCYAPTFIQESLMSLTGIGIAYTDYWQCDSRLKPYSLFATPYGNFKENCIKFALEKNMFVNFSSIIIPKVLFNHISFKKELRHGEDLIFLLDSIPWIGDHFYPIHKPLLYYRIHKGQGTNLNSVTEWKLLWDNINISLQKLGVEEEKITQARQANFKHLYEKSNTSAMKTIARNILNTIPHGQAIKKKLKAIV